jgi:4-amino-4-deoxy-L-arabinose transferase-like glycosyltransferase
MYMELSMVVWVVALIVLALLLMKFLGKVFSLAFSVLGILIVVWLVVAGLRWMDEQNLRDNIIESNNLFLLADGDNMITGFSTLDGEEQEIPDSTELTNPNSELYDEYYKVIVVDKESLPEKTSLMLEAAEPEDKLALFQTYVETGLLESDGETAAETLISEEQEGNIAVYKETLAFKHGIKEVLGS